MAPVAFVYAFVAYKSGDARAALLLLAIGMLLLVSLALLMRYAKKNLARSRFKVNSIEAADRENIAFLILYIFPLFTSEIGAMQWYMTGPALLIFALIIGTGYGYHFNPLLGLLGWHFYKVGTEEGVTYVLITKRELRSARGAFQVGQLTEYIVLDLEDFGGPTE